MKGTNIMAKTLRELALQAGYGDENLTTMATKAGNGSYFLNLDERHAIFQDDSGLHLTDLVSWASFAPRTIGRKSNATLKGLHFQLAQYRRYLAQIKRTA